MAERTMSELLTRPRVPFVWPVESIEPGGQRRTADGWVKRCWEPDCDVTWNNGDRAFPLYVLEHAQHGASHGDHIRIPGYNAAILG